MAKRIGKRTVILEKRPSVLGYAAIVGKKEHDGPIGEEFDSFDNDCRFGEKSFEKAESRLQKNTVRTALEKCALKESDIDYIFAGDLLNQCIGSSFGIRELAIPFVGLYGACSTMALSISAAALALESGAAEKTVSVTSSHFCSAERQYRFPLEYGSVRTPTAQWTVTGSGALVLGNADRKPYINAITIGKIEDYNITDANNMGAAMAPAAADTILNYFADTGTTLNDYDIIFTGDLGYVGSELLYRLLEREGLNIRCKHNDCGILIYDREKQDVHSGGSGCGCSASVLCSFIMHRFESGEFKNILFISTGALMSPTSSMQGESIPGIAHLINIKVEK